ncbi:aminobutyraldehyde dehydrogenase [Amycolatopsis saalfeldensis]|uniref:Betaine-aldehyde dehydrogenase n=1 Tax=Amycolatopsis saalfeldensis TaxID=394193 RepID=A0A1H8YR21_9PSEU|nr:aminobutyraldehyde dehydrogenase [Amycolatopsis saalfeldensis]SEP54543.1 betaine-aldehyde dehydrogenase [Amycolatopsis saalfeldensis]
MSEPEYQNFINGSFVPAESGRCSTLIDPVTETAYARAALSSANDVDAAFGAAAAAFASSWRNTPPAERQLALNRIADEVERRLEEFAAAEVRNCGKPLELTRTLEIPQSLDALRFFAGASRALEGKAAAEYLADHTSWTRREPLGVVGQIVPWNYPLLMACWKIGPALAAGDTVVLKPAETTPASATLLAEVAAEFLPPGVLNVVLGDRETGRAIVSHPTPRLISLTGSTRAGVEVATAGARDLKRMHLELGGKAPAVVFADADLAAAAAGIAEAAFFNAGQDCTAATRVLVEQSVAAEFTAELVARAGELTPGEPDDGSAFLGPLNNADQLARVEGFLKDLPGHAKVLAGGHRLDRPGYFVAPTVVAEVTSEDRIVCDEVFGPVVTVQVVADEAEAVERANDTVYGLASSIWTTNHERALRVSKALEFGCVWINTHAPVTGEMPHGGFRHSGYGKDLSVYALEEYTRVKHVMSNVAPRSGQ